MKVEDLLNYILSFLQNTKKEEEKVADELRIKELEQQDLLHELEFSKLNACEMAQITKQLIQVRKERRTIKNDLEKMRLLRRFTERQNAKNLNGEITTLLHELKKVKNVQKYGKYQPRILKNLKCSEKEANNAK